MVTCSSCGSRVSAAGRFCSACGAALSSEDMATMDFAAPVASRKQVSGPVVRPSSASGSLLTESRFLPGQLLATRYRIVALLGRGGMGEVYRADDLTLGQPVAVKFLPEEATKDEAMLERFRNEVRIARRVSHPNVCRVYDVGEVDGLTFFTMEYVDGEDLASLLRRIGRLPPDKGLEIARQLCAGLAAAHAKGVLHRDLKPANIMLDGRGQVVITDFGLAGLVEQFSGPDVRSGTPAYMSPEQLAGKEVTEKSDIYALGLVLYEIFTGKRAFDIETLPELVRVRSESAPSNPSTLVKDLDAAVERVILRCLETDPALRPGSVLNIAAALPGGDPLAAALAAGETPSPQMVAAAGQSAGLAPRMAVLCLIAAIAGLVLIVFLGLKASGMDKAGLEQSPEILSQKAREIIALLGYSDKPADVAFGFSYDTDFLNYVQQYGHQHPNWDKELGERPGPVLLWYRQSPHSMLPLDFHGDFLIPGIMTEMDPPQVVSGMINLELDTRGRLLSFQAIPPQLEKAAGQSASIDWNPLFKAASLDPAQFQPAAPIWNSLAASDSRAAWTGKWPETDRALRIEAAALHGKPVFFLLVGPWSTPDRMPSGGSTPQRKAANLIILVIFLSVALGSAVLARRNYKQGRGDRKGALRLALGVFVLLIALWLCRGHMVLSLEILQPLAVALSSSFFFAFIMWMLYLSLEPYVRRHWPQTLISWSRLLMGRIRDPLVGRDLLFGVLLGMFWLVIFESLAIWTLHLGDTPNFNTTDYLLGFRHTLGAWLFHFPLSLRATLIFFFFLFVARVALRRDWLAGIVFVAIWTTFETLNNNYWPYTAPVLALVYTIIAIMVFRVGLIPLATAIFCTQLLGSVPLTADFSAWYMGNVIFPFLSVAALAVWGFYTALAGQKLWNPEAFS